MNGRAIVLRGDAATLPLPDSSVDLVVCSPPYFGLRSYTDGGQHYQGQIGSESTPAEYIAALIACTREWVRVLKPDGSLFVNLGDKYQATSFDPTQRRKDASGVERPTITRPCERCGTEFTGGPGRRFCSSYCGGSDNSPRSRRQPIPNKSLLGLPWRYALACTDQLALILRAEIIWDKPNGLPESVTDRVRRSHEQIFHFTRQPRYYSAVDEVRETYLAPMATRTPGRRQLVNAGIGQITGISDAIDSMHPLGKLPGSVWSIPSAPLTVPPSLGIDHFAAYPPELVRRIILGWSPPAICTACRQGRRPVVDRGYIKRDNGHPVRVARYTDNNFGGSSPLMRDGTGYSTATITGYACACPRPDAPARPAIILDPFGGTGTTALTAAAYGRTGITIDRSGDYCRLASWRVHDPAERARAMHVPKPPPVPDGQGSLFDAEEAAL